MPVEYLKENPRTGTGVYYPACTEGALYAYHGIAGRIDPKDYNERLVAGPQKLMATEEAFRRIWQQGFVYSSVVRKEIGVADQSSMFFGMDRAAGDDQFVFLNVCKPHSAGYLGYHLVFDPYKLVSEGALIGLDDMQGIYMSIAGNLEVEDRNDDTTWTEEQKSAFREDVEFAQQVWRMRGGEAIDWLEWVQGLRNKSPVNAAALLYVSRQLDASLENVIKWLATSRQSAINNAEILIPDQLPLDWLVGVIFRKNWIEIDDFVEFYGPPGSEPPPALDFSAAFWVEGRTGHPARCMRCGDWLYLAPLEIPEDRGTWYSRIYHDRMVVPGTDKPIRVMRCSSCGAAFDTGGFTEQSFEEEQYAGQFEDLEHAPYR